MRLLPYLVTIIVTVFVTLFFVDQQRTNAREAALVVEPMKVHPWLFEKTCVEMNDAERKEAELALDIWQSLPRLSPLSIGALKYFGRTHYRREGEQYQRLCVPEEIYEQITATAIERYFSGNGYLNEYPLRVARNLGPRDQRIIDAVGRTAFHERPTRGERGEDTRSLARVTLAEFGSAASAYSDQSFQEISADDALGTSAAMLAVATGHPDAPKRAAQLLSHILDKYPADPIPIEATARIFELSDALALAGPDARPHAPLLIDILKNRKVGSWAGHFGLLSVRPVGLCNVLKQIGGDEAELAVQDGSLCSQVSSSAK